MVLLNQDWEEGLPWPLLADREMVQDRPVLRPNELVFGYSVSGPFKMLRDAVVPLSELGDGQGKAVIVQGEHKS